jgi:GT2 family glycosyltransferase
MVTENPRNAYEPSRHGAEAAAISVIICCYNGEATLAETLEAICNQKWMGSWEVILSDNGSTDQSVATFQGFASHHPEIPMRVVDASAKRGAPYARNVGVREANGSSILFCDADDVVGTDWLSSMAVALERRDFVAARLDLQKLNPEWVVGTRRNSQEFELPRTPYTPHLYHAGGGTMGFRKALFERIGGFDESLLGLEDTDFCFRAQLAGFDLHYVPDAVVYVRARSDARAIFRQAYNQAKYSLILSKRYKEFGPPNPGRWRRFFRRWIQASRQVLRLNHDIASKAKAGRALGWAAGLTVGILQERHPPP